MRIRRFCTDDLDQSVRLWYDTWHHTYPTPQHPQSFDQWKVRFQDMIAIGETILIAEVDRCIVALMSVRETEGRIHLMYVAPEWQRQGTGSALIRKAKEVAPKGLKLITLQQNRNAIAFYEKHGFKPVGSGFHSMTGEPNVEYLWKPNGD